MSGTPVNRKGAQRPPDAQAVADFLRALAHPMRLQILHRLLDGEAAVAAFETELGLKQPNLSQQLGLLREANLVATRREAKSIFYRLTDERVRAVLAVLGDAFNAAPGHTFNAASGNTFNPASGDAFNPAPQQARTPSRHTGAGQRPTVLAQARRDTRPPRRQGSECGVFSVAGWDTVITSAAGALRDE